MAILTAKEAIRRLKNIIGEDLRQMADQFGVTVFKEGNLNKGWAGHTLEHYLGLGLSSEQAPNGGLWELKVVPLKEQKGIYVPKETMAITMINAEDVMDKDFESSHLFHKLRSLVICGRLFEGKDERHSTFLSVGSFDLIDAETEEIVRKDYELVQQTIKTKGFSALTGEMGVLVQPRTKGPGHGSTSRAFYARTQFVKKILNL